MLSCFYLVRLIICIVLFILMLLIIKSVNKFKKYYNRLTIRRIIDICFLFFIISLLINFEHTIFEFNSPEMAYYYSKGLNKINIKVEGEKSVLLMSKNSDVDIILRKNETKWQIRKDFRSKLSFHSYRYNNIVFTSYNYRNEYYLKIFIKNGNNTIYDNRDTNFILDENENKGYNYYGYIKDYDKDYILNINGRDYKVDF